MKVILYMAISINGLITRGSGDDSDWVTDTDWGEFYRLAKKCKIMVMGRRTYEIWGDDFPCERVVNVVMTSKKNLLSQKSPKNVIFTSKSPKEVVEMAKKKGFSKLFLIGGMKLNTSFFQDNLIDEIYLSIHPLLFGKGMKIMREVNYEKSLKLLGVKKLSENLVQLHYKVKSRT
jgi:dihydrofolate reductase